MSKKFLIKRELSIEHSSLKTKDSLGSLAPHDGMISSKHTDEEEQFPLKFPEKVCSPLIYPYVAT